MGGCGFCTLQKSQTLANSDLEPLSPKPHRYLKCGTNANSDIMSGEKKSDIDVSANTHAAFAIAHSVFIEHLCQRYAL